MSDDPEQPSAENPPPENPPEQRRDAELADMRDRMLRALADAENTRRRAERERLEVSQYAIARFARDMLQIADNFGRALAACPKDLREGADPQVKAVIDGVEATERQLLATLEQYGVKMIATADAKFDPNLHQAIAEVPGEGKSPGTIVNVVQTGYTIGDRLLRPAMVTVARKENGNGVDTKV
ncbi:MAG: nucleotide exchange factor GrpE [Alphaproteobacteria bacterium]|nr:nucleotide exchange factor GrpE [Alphaproteobacteria bacterium]MDE2629754.1 nucleotide exchange factor GrpE [Alphaproteobacteria bacterium]